MIGAVAPTPRIRLDLTVAALTEDGTRFFDVTHPTTGAALRMNEQEWMIARRLDGTQSFDELVVWARERLSLEITLEALGSFTDRLREAGFFDEAGAAAPPPPKHELVIDDADEPAPRAAAKANPALMAALGNTVKKAPGQPQDVEAMKAFFRKAPPVDEPARRRPSLAPALSSSVLSGMGIVAIAAALPALVYFTFVRVAPPAQVHVQAAAPEDLLELYDGEAPVRGVAPVPLAFTAGGTLAEIVPSGTRLAARAQVAVLEDYAKAQDELTHLTHRQTFYEKQLAEAQTAGKPAEIQKAEKKVAEKKGLIAQLQARIEHARLLAPQAGVVTDVTLQPGAEVKPGVPVAKLTDPKLGAVFNLPVFSASSLGDGATVTLQRATGPLVKAHASTVKGEIVTIDIDPATGIKDGEKVRMVKLQVPQLVTVPPSAVVQRGGMSTVFVLSGDEAHARTVTVQNRAPTEVRVKNLQPGDAVIIDPPSTLQDRDKATRAP
jgi:hypothetical protein